jgi:hypothetical protein
MYRKTEADTGLTGLAGRFIAETNAFLARYWGHSNVGWPLRASEHASAAARPDGRSPPDGKVAMTDRGVLEATDTDASELIAHVKRLRQLLNEGEHLPNGAEDVYVIVVLVPEAQSRRPFQGPISNVRIGAVPSTGGNGNGNGNGNGTALHSARTGYTRPERVEEAVALSRAAPRRCLPKS